MFEGVNGVTFTLILGRLKGDNTHGPSTLWGTFVSEQEPHEAGPVSALFSAISPEPRQVLTGLVSVC